MSLAAFGPQWGWPRSPPCGVLGRLRQRCHGLVQISSASPIWSLPVEEVETALQTGPDGLSAAEAETRLRRFGPNRLPELRRHPLWRRFTDELVHFMALLLWAAGAMAFAVRRMGQPPPCRPHWRKN